MKRIIGAIAALILCIGISSCGAANQPSGSETADPFLPDGTYSALFTTDSSMFHVNETLDDRGTLTVENGQMSIHITLAGKGVLNLYSGLAESAKLHEEEWLIPTTDEVRYPDGLTEIVNGFDVPVPALDTDFDLALVGKKGTWYDHKVSVSDPQPLS